MITRLADENEMGDVEKPTLLIRIQYINSALRKSAPHGRDLASGQPQALSRHQRAYHCFQPPLVLREAFVIYVRLRGQYALEAAIGEPDRNE
jgi:hypothetical protein